MHLFRQPEFSPCNSGLGCPACETNDSCREPPEISVVFPHASSLQAVTNWAAFWRMKVTSRDEACQANWSRWLRSAVCISTDSVGNISGPAAVTRKHRKVQKNDPADTGTRFTSGTTSGTPETLQRRLLIATIGKRVRVGAGIWYKNAPPRSLTCLKLVSYHCGPT
jgi:hypothetical protein